MTTEGSYNASTHNRDLDSELQRLQAQVLLSWEKESRNLTWFGLVDGMSVLEVGSGPGFFTEKLLSLLPHSLITAVEIDPVLVEKAEQYLRPKASNRLNLIRASVMETNLPANSFDFAIARLVFCHLPAPIGTAKEILRVLKPSGKLVIIDFDLDLFRISEPPYYTPIALERFGQFMATRGGNARAGRYLCRILSQAGFSHLDLEAVVSHSDLAGIEAFQPILDTGPLSQIGKLGLISKQELENFFVARDKFLSSSNPLIMNFWLMACGKKP